MIEELVKVSILIITFSIAAAKDWRTREINPSVWIPSLAVGLPLGVIKALNGLTVYQLLSIIISLVIVSSVAVLVFVFKLMGGADFLAITSFTVVYPYVQYTPFMYRWNSSMIANLSSVILVLPPIVAVLIVYTVVMTLFLIYNILHNLKHMDFLGSLETPLHKKLYIVLFHRIVDVDTIYRKRFYYPILVPGRIERRSFDVYEDDLIWREKLSDIPKGTRIVASWGIPMVTFFSISTFIYLILYLLVLLNR
ncbi:MAG: prepilin peptidase [Ignisphaera sp.]|nr:prepilin peptidase [Ignisphaera sp.]MCX8167469.1 prepilin peptidase [Ignisphaera sp.]MDW8084667.1 prepilin peptidase [Ignisphaera sp.]